MIRPRKKLRKLVNIQGGGKRLGEVDRRLLSFLRYSLDFEQFEDHSNLMG
jgi:hypothetical protein